MAVWAGIRHRPAARSLCKNASRSPPMILSGSRVRGSSSIRFPVQAVDWARFKSK